MVIPRPTPAENKILPLAQHKPPLSPPLVIVIVNNLPVLNATDFSEMRTADSTDRTDKTGNSKLIFPHPRYPCHPRFPSPPRNRNHPSSSMPRIASCSRLLEFGMGSFAFLLVPGYKSPVHRTHSHLLTEAVSPGGTAGRLTPIPKSALS